MTHLPTVERLRDIEQEDARWTEDSVLSARLDANPALWGVGDRRDLLRLARFLAEPEPECDGSHGCGFASLDGQRWFAHNPTTCPVAIHRAAREPYIQALRETP